MGTAIIIGASLKPYWAQGGFSINMTDGPST